MSRSAVPSWKLHPIAGALLALVSVERRASADEGCGVPSVETNEPELAERVRRALEHRDDIDGCARVIIRRRSGARVVDVILPDGRSTSRTVPRSDDVVPVVEALVLVPRGAAPPTRTEQGNELVEDVQPKAEPIQPSAPAPPAAAPDEVPRRDSGEARPRDRSSRLRVDLSVLSAGRLGDDRMGVGIGVMSFVDADGWLAGFTGRVDHCDGGRHGGPPDTSVSLALLGGHRFRMRALSLDIYGGPGIAVPATDHGMEAPRPVGVGAGGTRTVAARAFAGARLSFPSTSVLRTFLGIDADIGGRGAPYGQELEEHPLALWTLGLAVGATVGSR